MDYLTTQRAYTHASASLIYTGLGIGATMGGFCSHWFARQVGIYTALLLIIAACFLLALCIFSHSVFIVGVSCFLIGLSFTAIVMLKSTRLLELDKPQNHASLWGVMTIGFAIGQVIGTYVVIYFNHHLKQYGLSFIFAAMMFAITLFFVTLAKNSREQSNMI